MEGVILLVETFVIFFYCGQKFHEGLFGLHVPIAIKEVWKFLFVEHLTFPFKIFYLFYQFFHLFLFNQYKLIFPYYLVGPHHPFRPIEIHLFHFFFRHLVKEKYNHFSFGEIITNNSLNEFSLDSLDHFLKKFYMIPMVFHYIHYLSPNYPPYNLRRFFFRVFFPSKFQFEFFSFNLFNWIEEFNFCDL